MLRTHTCGELRPSHLTETVTLCGWVDRVRDHKGVIFIDLRDRWGKTQVVIGPDAPASVMERARAARPEWVMSTTGRVGRRPEGTTNPKLDTGEVEVVSSALEILNEAETPVFQPGAMELPGEEVRLKNRWLDLRRTDMQNNLLLRSRIVKIMRDHFDELGFVDVETPMLGRSTPEGARDYLVPSRLEHGAFFALPQSPQLYKQLLMIAGFDKYFQIARCMRDEDSRKDRQPEFTQLDLEMAFVNEKDIQDLIERLLREIVKLTPKKKLLKYPLPRLTYKEAIDRFGIDKPDLRFGLELKCVSEIAKGCGFKVFSEAIKNKGEVKGIAVPGCAKHTRAELDKLTEKAKELGAQVLAWIKCQKGKFDSPIAKFFKPEELKEIAKKLEAKSGDLMIFVADKPKVVASVLGELRNYFGKELKLANQNILAFAWITDFPM
ncbi:MAG: aspartate--tRNA ligase, partial [Pirellulales bacterium]|nr:aspartate--tRNA ligase [Pirellulales bacterium]